jgi:DNA-binding MarR family transcriptional regulator
MIDPSERRETAGEDVSLGGLETTVGFVLRLAQVAVFKDLLAALKSFDLRVTDLSVLLVIEATPGLQQRAIGEVLRIQRPNLVTIIDQLEARGLVRRGAVPGDRRAYALSLTPEGETLLGKAKIVHAQHDRKVIGGGREAQDVSILRDWTGRQPEADQAPQGDDRQQRQEHLVG